MWHGNKNLGSGFSKYPSNGGFEKVLYKKLNRRSMSATFVTLLAAQLTLPLTAMAQQAPTSKNVDLSSTTASVTVPQSQHQSANIHVGGNTLAVSAGSTLTPAEYAAFMQVIHSGTQSLQLGALGNAVGGTVNLSGSWTANIGNLTVPSNVTAISNFGTAGTALNLSNLNNSGNIFAVSTNPNVTNAVINASNIQNNQGALITSVLPAAGLTGIVGALNNLNLQLNVVNNIVNAGSITSAGNLNINAGGSITNALPAGITGSTPVMQAMNNLSLTSQLGTLVNAGLMSAVNGNVNIASLNNLSVNNLGGSVQALNGQINLRDSLFSGSQNLTLTGGDWLSKELNLYTGSGALDAQIGKMSGVLNGTACSAEVLASTGNFQLGNMQVSGDPIFGNLTGDFQIGAGGIAPTNGAPLLIYAAGNISAADNSTINTSNAGGAGGNVFIIAGGTAANIAGNSFIVRDCKGCGGGNINLGSTPINTTGSAGGQGGNVTLFTLGGELNPGTISIGDITTIAPAGGNVQIISDANAGNVNGRTSVLTGSITTGNGNTLQNPAMGNVTIATAHPTLTSGDPNLAFCQPCIGFAGPGIPGGGSGALQAKSTVTVGATQNMSIQTNAISTAGGSVTINAGFEYTNLSAGGISTAASIPINTSGNVSISVNSPNVFELASAGAATNRISSAVKTTSNFIGGYSGSPSFQAGSISITNSGTGGIRVNDASLYQVTDSKSNNENAGNITLSAPNAAIFFNSPTPLTSNGSQFIGKGGNGGNITLNATRFVLANNAVLQANGAAQGSGGQITITESDPTSTTSIGSGVGQFFITAQGGASGVATGANGGQLTVSTAGPITLSQGAGSLVLDPTSGNGNGGSISLSTSKNTSGIFINSNINLPGSGLGTGGSLTINSASNSDFTIDQNAVSTTNALKGRVDLNGGSGGTLSVTSAQGLILGSTGFVFARGFNARGGSLSLTASGTNGLTINNPGFVGANGNTYGGSISLNAPKGQLTLQNSFLFNLNANSNGDGGNFTATYDSQVGTYGVQAGTNFGNGGVVTITQTNPSASFSVGGAGSQVPSVIVNSGGGGNGGTINVSSAGNLAVSFRFISAISSGNGNGSTYSFRAGTASSPGNLLIDANFTSITSNGNGSGNGGSITLISNSSSPFQVITAGQLNGVRNLNGGVMTTVGGGTTGAAGTVTIDNEGTGGISLANNGNPLFSFPVTNGAGGTLNLKAPNGTVDFTGANNSLNVSAAGAAANKGGTINITAAVLNPIPNLTFNANGSGTGGGGSITMIQTAGTNAINIGPAAGNDYTLSAVAGAGGGSGGTISVTSGGPITLDMAGALAQPVNAGSGGSGANYTFAAGTVNASEVNIVSGNVDSSAVGTNQPGGNVTITASNGILVQGNINASGTGTASGGVITLTAATQQMFGIDSAGGQIAGVNGTIRSDGGSGGTINITNPGGIQIIGNNANTDISVTASGGSGGNLNFNASNGPISLASGMTFNLNAAGNTAGFNGGNLTLISTKLNLQGPLTVNANATGTSLAAGNGGVITVSTTAPGFDLDMSNVTISAQGGVANSLAGSGGTMNFTSAHNLKVDTSKITANPIGAAGVGTIWNLKAGTASPGDLTVTGNILADGVGFLSAASGGSVTLSASRNVFVNGKISANGGTGLVGNLANGGTISISTKSDLPFTVTAAAATNGVTGIISNSGGTNFGNQGALSIKNDGVGGIAIDPNQLIHTVTNGAGAPITLTASAGLISFTASGTIDTSAKGANAASPGSNTGGNVSITALGIESQGHTNIFSKGSDGKGGDINLNATGASSVLQFDTVGNNTFALDGSGGVGGNAGNLTMSAGARMLILNPSAVNSVAGAGAVAGTFTFNSNGSGGGCCGTLFYNGTVVGHNASSYVFNVNTSSPFVIGGTVTNGNGINGNVDLSGSGGTGGGNFTVNQSGTGGIVFANGATINTSAKTDSALGPGFSVAGGGAVNINSGSGGLIVNNNSIDASSTYFAFSGGAVKLSATTIISGAGQNLPFQINASGGAGAAGGSINIATTSSLYNLNVGNTNGSLNVNFNLNASGGEKGGSITLSSANNLVIDPNFMKFGPTTAINNPLLGYSGDGGTVSLTAPAQLYVNGNLAANGVGVGDGGSVSVSNGGTIQNNFLISSVAFFNGIRGTLTVSPGITGGSGGTINLNLTGFLFVPGGSSLSASASGTAGTGGIFNGGNLTLNIAGTSLVQNNGTITLSADAAGNGNGGSVSLTQSNVGTAIIVGSQSSQLNISAKGGSTASLLGDGGKISLNSPSNLLMDTTLLNANPQGTNGAGAQYSLTSNGSIITTNAVQADFTANANGLANGGTINISQGKNGGQLLIGVGSLGSGINGNIKALGGATGGKGGSISISLASTNALVLQANTVLDASGGAGGGDGGSITLNSNTLTQTGLTSSKIQANGSVQGNGGTISITALQSPLTLGNALGQVQIFANGGSALSRAGDAGSVTLSTGTLIINAGGLNVAPLGSIGKGATLNFTTTGQLLSNINLNADGAPLAGDGGSISLFSGFGGTFNIGNPSVGTVVNGINGASASLSAAAQGVGKGGTISVQNDFVGITVNTGATFNVTGGSYFKSGEIKLSSANGTLSVLIPSISVNGNTNGGGGKLTLAASQLTGPTGGPLTLSADGVGTADGGSVSVTTTNIASSLTIGNLVNQITVTARGGVSNFTDNGGSITLAAGSNLTVSSPVNTILNVDSRALNGNGGTISLSAGSANPVGQLFVDGNISANGVGVGNGGSISFSINHLNSLLQIFTIGAGGGQVQGVNGTVSANAGAISGNGGSINYTNSTGNTLLPVGIKFLANQTLFVNSSANGTPGNITILANDQPITFAGATGSVFNANGTGIASPGGNISMTGSAFIYNAAANVQFNANASGTGKGGSVSLVSTGAAGLGSDINTGAGAGAISVSATGGSANSSGGAGGTVTLSASSVINNVKINGGLSFGPTGNVGDGGSITISSGNNVAITGVLSANATTTGNGGNITISEASTNNSLPFLIGGISNNGATVGIFANAPSNGSGGKIVINATGVGGISLGAGQAVGTGGGAVSASGGDGGSITLNSGSNGDVNLANSSLFNNGSGFGNGGNLTITTRNLLQAAGSNPLISVQSGQGVIGANGLGRGGTITISANTANLNINNTAGTIRMNVAAVGDGQGGTINVTNSLGNLNVNSAGLTLINNLETGANVSFTGSGVGSSINTTGSINVGKGDNASLSLVTSGAGGFINQAAASTYSGRAITLTSLNNIGTQLAPVQVAAGSDAAGGLKVNSTNPGTQVFLQQTGVPVTVGASSAGISWSLTSDNSITAVAPISATQITLKTTANNAPITINANVGGPAFSSTDTITANGSGAIRDLGGIFNAATVVLNTTSGNIGSVANRATANSTNTITVNTTGSVFLNNSQSIVFLASTAGTALDFQTTGNLVLTGAVTSPTVVLGAFASQFVPNGGPAIDGNITAGAAALSTVNNFGISVGNNAFVSSNNSLNITGATLSGNLQLNTVGALAFSGRVIANNITAFSNSTLTVNAAAPMTAQFNAAVPGTGSLSLSALNNVTLGSAITGNNITIQSLANNGNIAINAPIATGTTVGAPNLFMLTTGTGNITTTGAGSVISGNSALLVTALGSVGAFAAPLLSQMSTLSIQAAGPAAQAFVTQSVNPLTMGATVVGNQFTLNSTTDVSTGPIIQVGTGGVGITVAGGNLTVGTGSIITTGSGNIVLTTDKNIVLNPGVINATGTGNVQIIATGATSTITQNLGSTVIATNGNNVANALLIQDTTVFAGPITLNGTLQTLVGGDIKIQADRDIVQAQGFVGSAGNLTYTSINGNLSSAANIAVNQAINGNINIDSNSGNTNWNGITNRVGAGAGTISVTAKSGMTMGNFFNANGSISAFTVNGNIGVNNFAVINSQGSTANITLQDNSTNVGQKITVGQAAQLISISPTAGQGKITLAIGGAPVIQAGAAPANVNQVLIGTGTINYSTAGIAAAAPVNTLISKNSVLTFSIQGGMPAGSITLGGSDVFNADPPAAGSVGPALPAQIMPTSPSAPVAVKATENGAQLTMPAQLGTFWSNVQNVFNQAINGNSQPGNAAMDTASSAALAPTPVPAPVTAPAIAPAQNMTAPLTNARHADVTSSSSPNMLTGGVAKIARGSRPAVSYMRTGFGAQVDSSNADQLELLSGDMLVSADHTSSIKCGNFSVEVGAGSVVHMSKEGNVTKVRNLLDQPGHGVRVLVEGKALRLGLGEELLMGDNNGSVRAALANEKLGRRNVDSFVIRNKHEIIRSEFSVIHLIQSSKLLSSLYFKGDKADQAMMGRVMKMAACLFQVSGKRGVYKADAKPVLTIPAKASAPVQVAQTLH